MTRGRREAPSLVPGLPAGGVGRAAAATARRVALLVLGSLDLLDPVLELPDRVPGRLCVAGGLLDVVLDARHAVLQLLQVRGLRQAVDTLLQLLEAVVEAVLEPIDGAVGRRGCLRILIVR